MYRPVSAFIATRFFLKDKGEGYLSFMSLASLLGLCLGTGTLVVVLSVVNGFEREFKERVLGLVSHLKVYSYDPDEDWVQLAEKITANNDVISVAPFSYVPAMLSANATNNTVVIKGIDTTFNGSETRLQKYLQQGVLPQKHDKGIVLTTQLSKKTGLAIGDPVMILIADSQPGFKSLPRPRFFSSEVTAIIDTQSEIDNYQIYTGIDQTLEMRRASNLQGLEAHIRDVYTAETVSNQLYKDLGSGYRVIPWTYSHSNLYEAIKLPKTIFSLLFILIVIVAAFNVTTSLIMMVGSKVSEIAVLRTVGATNRTIMAIFITLSAVLGTIGISIGVLAGMLFVSNLNDLIEWVETVSNVTLFQRDQYFVHFLPYEIRLPDILAVVIGSIIITIASAIYPAHKASRIHPSEALRYD